MAKLCMSLVLSHLLRMIPRDFVPMCFGLFCICVGLPATLMTKETDTVNKGLGAFVVIFGGKFSLLFR